MSQWMRWTCCSHGQLHKGRDWFNQHHPGQWCLKPSGARGTLTGGTGQACTVLLGLMYLSRDLWENDLSYREQKFSLKMLFNSKMSFPLQNVFLFTLFPFFSIFFSSFLISSYSPFLSSSSILMVKVSLNLRLFTLPHHSQPFCFSWGKFHLIVSTCKYLLSTFTWGFILTCFRGTVLICASTTYILFLACKGSPACTVELLFGQTSPSINKHFIVKKNVFDECLHLGVGWMGCDHQLLMGDGMKPLILPCSAHRRGRIALLRAIPSLM